MLKAKIIVKLKEGVDDPEGKTIRHTLNLLGFENVEKVNVAKYYEIFLNENMERGREEIEKMIKKLLVNPVIHEYELEVEEI